MDRTSETETSFEPGAARFGNFISYYNFHPPEERILLLPEEMLLDEPIDDDGVIAILDIGCNTGELTERVHELLETRFRRRCCTLAVDLDPILIKRAREAAKSTLNVTFEVADVNGPQFMTVANNFLEALGKNKFDVSFLFSVTMWIHLNCGDAGLKNVLSRVSSISRTLVLEPQPWRCYRAAVRRMKRSRAEPFELFDKLRLRSGIEDDIANYIKTHCNMVKIAETPRTNWGRKIYIFR